MTSLPEGNAIIYCEGAFNTTNGKTAHGLVRYTKRYNVLSVIDSSYAGKDAGEILDGKPNKIPIYGDLQKAINEAINQGDPATYFVIGLAPDGGRLPIESRKDILTAVENKLNIDSGLHDYLIDDPEISELAKKQGITLRDIRKPPDVKDLHFFTGKIEEVKALKIAYLGTDSAVGKRTSAVILYEALQKKGYRTEMIGTGQTSWMQGIKHSIIFDSLVNDFVSGEIEHIVWTAWKKEFPDVIIIEGQGSIMNPAYPGGFEILAAARPDIILVQHVPTRLEYDGFQGYPLHPLKKQIEIIKQLSDKPVVAVTISHEGLKPENIPKACQKITESTGLPAFDLLTNGANDLVKILTPYLNRLKDGYL
jgi:uncharacterized NAD-dependent epimerase/dehydratase family protein